MTPQEQQMLKGLTDRVNQTQLNEKDPDAERYLQDTLGRNPDGLYILAQTVLVQQYALDQAKKQLDQMKQQLDQANLDLNHARQQAQQPKHATSFLGSLLGMNEEPAAPPPPPPPAQQPAPARYAPVANTGMPQGYVQAPQYGQPQYQAQPSGGGFFGGGQPGGGQPGGGGSFLRSAMTTATGVAAGALAFEGIESLMHGFGQHAGYGGGSGFGGFGAGEGARPEIINNYYNEGPLGEHASGEHHGDLGDRFSAAGDQTTPDLEDRRGDSRSDFADTTPAETNTDDTLDNDTQADDAQADDSADNFLDDSNTDDSSGDDSGSFDDSGDSGSSDDSSF